MTGAVGALSAFYADSMNVDDAREREISAHRLIAKMPTIAARAFKYTIGQPFVSPRNNLSYSENFLRMCFAVPAEDWVPNPVLTKAMDRIFILHADHEQNASTSTVVIPVLLIRHVLGTRGAHELFGVTDNYTYALWAMWPGESVRLALLIALVWIHGCIGLHMWLSSKPWYRRNLWAMYGLAVLIPALAYAGYVSAGRMLHLRGDVSSPFSAAQYAEMQQNFHAWFLHLSCRSWPQRSGCWVLLLMGNQNGRAYPVRYAYGPTISAARGLSVLEISQMNRIPHASVCGGRARCSTCRVRVLEGQDQLPAASVTEQQVLRRVGAPANVRLACQLRPTADLTISTLLPANLETGQSGDFDKYHWGVEREVTLLFCDLRGFTQMSEGRLSFDVVFLLNQFLGRMAEAIEDSGGFVDKFMGDGIMAIFGMETHACRGRAPRHRRRPRHGRACWTA